MFNVTDFVHIIYKGVCLSSLTEEEEEEEWHHKKMFVFAANVCLFVVLAPAQHFLLLLHLIFPHIVNMQFCMMLDFGRNNIIHHQSFAIHSQGCLLIRQKITDLIAEQNLATKL